MPSDNLENFFRQKTEEVQHTPPPQYPSWTPEKSWDHLQPLLPGQRRKAKPNFYLGLAAGLVLALLAGLALYRTPDPVAPLANVLSAPAPLSTSVAENEPKKPSVTFTQPSGLLATRTASVAGKSLKNSRSNKTERTQSFEPVPEMLALQEMPQQATPTPTNEPGLAATPVAPASSQPLKITIVLGAKTLARTEAVAWETDSLPPPPLATRKKQRKEKIRLRIHHPDAGLPTDTQLASTKFSSSDIGLGTRIKF